jgi:hypothetical protein
MQAQWFVKWWQQKQLNSSLAESNFADWNSPTRMIYSHLKLSMYDYFISRRNDAVRNVKYEAEKKEVNLNYWSSFV